MTTARLFHTVRHLRASQVLGRVRWRLGHPRPGVAGLPGLALPGGPWLDSAQREPTLLGPSRVRFLSREGAVAAPTDWNRAGHDKLWLYNLHYFDDLNARDWPARGAWHRALIGRWVAENPPFAGTGWEPYPTSLRIVNWLKWTLAGNPLEAGWAASLALQARYLVRRIEWHLLGNHLLANAKALVFAGTCFRSPEADRWLAKGLEILRGQIPEQVLADGGHFERSPMYHAIVLEDLLDLVNLARAAGPSAPPQAAPGHPLPPPLGRALRDAANGWAQTAVRMQGWLAALCHPDGEIALVNDAALGIAPAPAELAAYARRLGLARCAPPSSPVDRRGATGYLRLALGPAFVLLDVGEIGPDYLPGHAHADTLSFELSLWGRRAIVDSGTSCYGTGPERLRQRGTAAHNTVEIDGTDSSEVWGGFRVARRARPLDLTVCADAAGVRVACAHDGFRWLPGRPRHRRVWILTATSMTVRDRIEGSFATAVARLHLHPQLTASPGPDGRTGTLSLGGHRCAWSVRGAARVRLVTSSYHPRFGVAEPSQCLESTFAGAELETTLSWGEPEPDPSPAKTR